MKNEARAEQYAPLQKKTFKNALMNFIQREFPFVGGSKVVQLMVNEIDEIYKKYNPQSMKVGQILWMAVARDEASAQRKGMGNLKKVPVVLTLVSEEDIQRYIDDMPMKEIRQHVIARMLREAKKQGGILAEVDVAAILSLSRSAVSKAILDYEKKYNVVLPRRGTEHDLGGTMTHKDHVIDGYNHKKATPDIAKEIDHDPEACDRYINSYRRILKSLKLGITSKDLPFVTGMSKRLAQEYERLAEKYNPELFINK